MNTRAVIKELTAQQARLETAGTLPPGQRWRHAVGSIKPNELTREAARLGAEWRAKENKRR